MRTCIIFRKRSCPSTTSDIVQWLGFPAFTGTARVRSPVSEYIFFFFFFFLLGLKWQMESEKGNRVDFVISLILSYCRVHCSIVNYYCCTVRFPLSQLIPIWPSALQLSITPIRLSLSISLTSFPSRKSFQASSPGLLLRPLTLTFFLRIVASLLLFITQLVRFFARRILVTVA